MSVGKSIDSKVAEVISTFDFMRVKQVMEYLHWTWAGAAESPSEEELVQKATKLLKEVSSKPGEVCGSGGLRASHRKNGLLSLKFVLTESWSAPPDEGK